MRMEKPPNQLVLLSRTVSGVSPPPHWMATRAPAMHAEVVIDRSIHAVG
jgi:hypothetical protein